MTTNKKMLSLTALQNYALRNKGKVQKSIISNAEKKTPRKQKTPHAQDSRKSKVLSTTENRSAVAWGGSPVKGTRGVERIVKAHKKVLGGYITSLL